MASRAALKSALQSVLPRAVDDLRRLCRQPSVSAQNLGLAETALLVDRLLQDDGGVVRVFRRPGAPPLVTADFPGRSPRTLLLYNHYDVQPPEPLDEWTSPPFEAALRDGKVYARGAADNKGDLLCRLAAVRAWREAEGELPCRVKFLVEGEEEVGSASLPAYLTEAADWLRSDACVWEFGGRDQKGRVDVYLGVKGLCYLELRARTAAVDLHSSLATIVPNAAWRLVWALASLKGADGRVRVPGFYEAVRQPEADAAAGAVRLPFDADELKRTWGVARLLGEGGRSDLRHEVLFAPTCTICGLGAGYQGPGSKTVLPREASAKVDFRLVPEQDPDQVTQAVRRHLDREGFADVSVVALGNERPWRTPASHPFVPQVVDTAREAYGGEVLLHPTSDGSGPMHAVGSALGVPMVSTGCGYWGSLAHAPDENIRIEDFAAGAYHMCLLMERFARSTW